MHKVYFKQAIHLLKADKVISIISILGTALAVTIVMTLIIVKDIKGANIAPEVNRDRSMYIKFAQETQKNRDVITRGPATYKQYQDFLAQLQVPEYITLINSRSNQDIVPEGYIYNYKADATYSDTNFWRLFSFSFIEGRPFNQEEFDSGVRVAVICESLARKLFHTIQAIGKVFTISDIEYRVIGVVKDVSSVFKYAYAQIWVPYTTRPNPESLSFVFVLLAKSKKEFTKIREEIREVEARVNNQDERYETSFMGPHGNRYDQFNVDLFDKEPSLNPAIRSHYILLIILLLIPAVNLSSISLSKVMERTSEIGVRKAFGAKHSAILIQVLSENMICTIIGSVIGLMASIGVVSILKNWLFSSGRYQPLTEDFFIQINSFLSPTIFLSVFFICLLLNILSAGIPAYRASRQNITDAMKK